MNATTSTRTAAATSDQFLDGMADDEATDLDDLATDEGTDEAGEDTEPEEVQPGEFATEQEFDKNTWQHKTREASRLYKRADGATKRASTLLWDGATEAIAEWEQDSDADVNAERLSHNLLVIMGTSRKGDVSKIKKVALAVRAKGLQTSEYPNLSKAYAEAKRLLDTAVIEEGEDKSADEAITAVAAEVPDEVKTAADHIAMAFALTGGSDEFARVTFDVVNHGGAENHEAHRAIVRAFAQEAQGRVKAAQDAEKAKAEADRAAAAEAKAKTASQGEANAAKRAQAATPGKAKTKATPTSASRGDANAKALPPKTEAQKAAQAANAEATEASTDEGAADLDALTDEAPAPAPTPAKKAAGKPRPRRA